MLRKCLKRLMGTSFGGRVALTMAIHQLWKTEFLWSEMLPTLWDLNLNPESCESVTVEPGHISTDGQRLAEVRGTDNGYSVVFQPHYRANLI